MCKREPEKSKDITAKAGPVARACKLSHGRLLFLDEQTLGVHGMSSLALAGDRSNGVDPGALAA